MLSGPTLDGESLIRAVFVLYRTLICQFRFGASPDLIPKNRPRMNVRILGKTDLPLTCISS